MSDLDRDGYTQRALAVAELAMAYEALKTDEMKHKVSRAMDGLLHHLDLPKGELKEILSPKAKESPK